MEETIFGYFFTMRAKPGRGAELRQLMVAANRDASAVGSWLIGTQDDETDSLVGMEFYQNDEAAALHDQDANVAKTRALVGELLAEPPIRIVIHPTATSLPLLRN